MELLAVVDPGIIGDGEGICDARGEISGWCECVAVGSYARSKNRARGQIVDVGSIR